MTGASVIAAQAHRLIAPGHDKAIASRRLARLCERGPNPGDDPYLRQIEYRRSDALPFPVWTLTPRGRAIADRPRQGWSRPWNRGSAFSSSNGSSP